MPRGRPTRILVPRLADAANLNAQNLNAKALLARFSSSGVEWIAPYYDDADEAALRAPRVSLVPLWRGRLWPWHLMWLYQRPCDAIVYAGAEWFDDWALRLRRWSGRRVPIVATLEGLVGDAEREAHLSGRLGHPVYCHRADRDGCNRAYRVLEDSARIIAISPMLAEVGSRLYGDKVAYCPLGVDLDVFHARQRLTGNRYSVVGAGNMIDRKRPWVFAHLARRFPEADFTWFGSGPLRASVSREAAAANVSNLHLAPHLVPRDLANTFRGADLFVLPSHSEGAPKVLQEAAACGLPAVAFGFYHPPSLVDGSTGYIVWSDEELVTRVGELIRDRDRSAAMGARAAEQALAWSWDRVAPLWEAEILQTVARPAEPSLAHREVSS